MIIYLSIMSLLCIHNSISRKRHEPKYFRTFYQQPHIRKKGYGLCDQCKSLIGFLIASIFLLNYGIPMFSRIDSYYFNLGQGICFYEKTINTMKEGKVNNLTKFIGVEKARNLTVLLNEKSSKP